MERILIIIALLTCIILVGYCIYYRNREDYYIQSKPIYYLLDPKSIIKNGKSTYSASTIESTLASTLASTSASTLASTSSSIVTSPADPTGPAGTTDQTEQEYCYLCFNNRCYSEDQLDKDTHLPKSDSKFIPGPTGSSSKCVKCSSIGTPIIGMCEDENNTPVKQNDAFMGCICHDCDQGKCIYHNMTTNQTRQSGPNCNSNASPPPPPTTPPS